MGENFDRLAAENNRRNTAAPARGHQDQIAPVRGGGVDDRLVNLPALGMTVSQATPPSLLGVSLRMLNVFVSRVFELARREREHGERLCDRHRGDFGTDLLGESDTVLNRLGGEVRPVGRDRYILVQGSPLLLTSQGISSSR